MKKYSPSLFSYLWTIRLTIFPIQLAIWTKGPSFPKERPEATTRGSPTALVNKTLPPRNPWMTKPCRSVELEEEGKRNDSYLKELSWFPVYQHQQPKLIVRTYLLTVRILDPYIVRDLPLAGVRIVWEIRLQDPRFLAGCECRRVRKAECEEARRAR